MDFVLIPNVLSLILSLFAAVYLFRLSHLMRGGQLSTVFSLIVWGILLSVTVHSAFEVGDLLGIISEETIFPIMGVLLSIGSACFIVAGIKGIKLFKP